MNLGYVKNSPKIFKTSKTLLSSPWVSFQDDIIDDVESFVAAAEILKERGAYKIFVMATHGLLSADAPRLIEESSIDEVSLFFGAAEEGPAPAVDLRH